MDEHKRREFRDMFIVRTRGLLTSANSCLLKAEGGAAEQLGEFKMVVHTLKGTAGMCSKDATDKFLGICGLCHAIEDTVAGLPKGETVKPQIFELLFNKLDALSAAIEDAFLSEDGLQREMQATRVSVSVLDRLMDLVSGLVVVGGKMDALEQRKDPQVYAITNELSQLTGSLRAEIEKVRLVALDHIFEHYPRMVHDIGKKLGKDAELKISGSEILVDRRLLDRIDEPMLHLLRNAVAHGIEPAAERAAAKKNPQGAITIEARRERNYCVISVSDDGAGVNREAVVRAALEKGIPFDPGPCGPTEADILGLLCQQSFSTAETANDIAGRGVGMCAVKSVMSAINGKLEMHSEVGKGTSFVVRFPASLAIVQAVLIKVGEGVYAVPLSEVAEVGEATPEQLCAAQAAPGRSCAPDEVPMLRLREKFGVAASENTAGGSLVLAELGGGRVGLLVDAIIDQREIVVKPLPKLLGRAKNFSGAAILGDGRLALILDISALSAA